MLSQKFPDCERGDRKLRGSFLSGPGDESAKNKANKYQSIRQMEASPTKGGKKPFKKTARAKMGGYWADDEDGIMDEKVAEKGHGKKGMFEKLLRGMW